MSLRDNILADARKVFLRGSQFAESITAQPPVGPPRTIQAIVARASMQRIGSGAAPAIRITIANDACRGIPVAEMFGYTLIFARDEGGAPQVWALPAAPLTQDGGMWTCEVR